MNAQFSGKYELLDQLAEEFADRFRKGERPGLHEYTERYPELADEIRELFPALVQVERVEPAVKAAAAPLRQVGDYRILRQIGRGGMGVVYEAEQASLGRRVALKVLPLHTGGDPRALERFKREARAAAKLHHTNIVPVFEVGEDGDLCFYAMQFIQGQGLDQVIAELRRLRSASDRRKQVTVPGEERTQERTQDLPVEELARSLLTGRFGAQDLTAAITPEAPDRVSPSEERHPASLSATDAKTAPSASSVILPGQTELSALETHHRHYCESVARIGEQTAAALAHAHERSIIHRDIKPSNLLLDASGIVWVTDFGLAKTEESDLTSPGDILGTFRYMAPERFKGRSDPRSDVYALGVTLYELLVLRPAFESCDRATLMAEITHDEPRRPRTFDRRIPRDLETIVMKAIAKDPARRYQAAAEMADDLRCFLESRAIKARRSSTGERLWRWCRRNPAVAALLGTVFLLLLCLAIGSIAVAVHLSRQGIALAAAEVDRTEKAYQTYQARVAQAYASRFSQRAGQRFETLKIIREAAALVSEWQMPKERIDELRNLAIAALTLPDVRTLRTWSKLSRDIENHWECDDQLRHYARREPDAAITVRRIDTDQEIAHFKAGPRIHFSPGGRFLMSYGRDRCFHILDLQSASPQPVPQGEEDGHFAFHPDGRHVLIDKRDGSLWLYDLTSPQQRPTCLVRLQPPATGLAFDPAGKRLAVIRAGKAEILDAETGRNILTLPEANVGHTPAWHPSGHYLALISSKSLRDIYVWDLKRTARTSLIKGSRSQQPRVAFSPDGQRLLGAASEAINLYDWRTGRQLLHHPGYSNLTFNSGGQFLVQSGNEYSVLALDTGQEYRSIVQQSADDEQVNYGEPIVHPEGRLLAVNMSGEQLQRVLFFDLETGDEVAAIPQGLYRIAFQADGTLLTNGSHGLLRWPMHHADASHWRVGPPLVLFPRSFVDMAADKNGEVIGQATGNGALLVRPGKGLVSLGPHGGAQHIAISPDGKHAITGINGGEEGIKLWDVGMRQLLKHFPLGTFCGGHFSPDGRWLAIQGSQGAQVVKTESWETVFTDEWTGEGVFSPDGSVLAVNSGQLIRFLEPATGRELARLQAPHQRYGWLGFSPDGAKLVSCSDLDRAIHLWDLRGIRKQLAELRLDWEAPPCPEARPAALSSLEVKVDLGSGFLDPRALVALSSFRLALNPFDFEAYCERGRAHSRLKENHQAIADYSTALALLPPGHERHGELLFHRSSNYRSLNDLGRAAVDLLEIAERDLPLPEDLGFIGAGQFNNLAWEYVAGPEKNRQPRKALPLVRKALKLTPENPLFCNTCGVAHYRLGEYPQAVEWLERSLRISHADGAAFDLYFLAMCHAKLGDPVKAKDCYDQAVRWVERNQSTIDSQRGWRQELNDFQAEARRVLASIPK